MGTIESFLAAIENVYFGTPENVVDAVEFV